MAKKKSCGSRGRWKSGPRKGHCRPKGKTSKRKSSRGGNFCVKARGAKCAVACFKSAKSALKFAKKTGGVATKGGKVCKKLSKKGVRIVRKGGARFTTLAKQIGR